jgi:hypothetical protein
VLFFHHIAIWILFEARKDEEGIIDRINKYKQVFRARQASQVTIFWLLGHAIEKWEFIILLV